MKHSILILIFLFCTNALSGKIGIDIGAGLKSNYGLLGFGIRYFPTKNFDLYYSGGVDPLGATSTIGTRVYSNPIGNKCFFFITCTPLYYIGIHTGRIIGGDVKVKEDDIESQYKMSNASFNGLNVGTFDLFGDWFYYSIDINYRSYNDEPEYELQSGPNNIKTEDLFDQLAESGIGYALNIGVLF
jgi:hypothetical protein